MTADCAIATALKPGARIVFEYSGGVEVMRSWAEPAEQVREREPVEIASRYLGYDASISAFTIEPHNRTRDERSTYHGYVYMIPLLRQLLAPQFTLEQAHSLDECEFLDVWVKR